MKKFFKFAAIAFAAVAMVSCDKNDTGKNDDNGDGATDSKKVLTALASKVDEEGNFVKGWKFFYHEDGKLATMNEIKEDGTIDWQLSFTWNGTVVTVNEVWEGENGPEEGLYCTYTIGTNGYFTECVKGKSTYKYEYDTEGHLTKVYESYDGSDYELKSTQTWTEGNLTSWTYENQIENPDGTKSPRIKRQTYKTDLNISGTHTIWNDKSANLKRWMLELGFFGKASKNLAATDKWDDSDRDAKFEYRTDDDEYVVSEVKYYKASDSNAYNLDDECYFLWQSAE